MPEEPSTNRLRQPEWYRGTGSYDPARVVKILCSPRNRFARASTGAAVAMAVTTAAWKTPERSGPTGPAISSLRSIQTPKPPDLARYVREEPVLIVLGKALFWDTQLSSDNHVACASCHFHAGADHRLQNQLSAVNGHVPPNQLLSSVHLPFSYQEREAGWRAASAGILPRRLTAVGEQGAVDHG